MSVTCKCLVKVEIRNCASVRLVATSSYLQWRDGSLLLGSLLSVSARPSFSGRYSPPQPDPSRSAEAPHAGVCSPGLLAAAPAQGTQPQTQLWLLSRRCTGILSQSGISIGSEHQTNHTGHPPSPFHSALVSHLTHKHCSHTHFSRLQCFSFPPSSLWIYNLVVSCNIFFFLSRLAIQSFLFM